MQSYVIPLNWLAVTAVVAKAVCEPFRLFKYVLVCKLAGSTSHIALTQPDDLHATWSGIQKE